MVKVRWCQRCGGLATGKCCSKPQKSSNRDGYDRRWRKFRERLIKKRAREGKLICSCGCGVAFGRDSPHADHIIPVTGQDDPLFFDESNIQLLRPECHGKKTKQDVARGLTR